MAGKISEHFYGSKSAENHNGFIFLESAILQLSFAVSIVKIGLAVFAFEKIGRALFAHSQPNLPVNFKFPFENSMGKYGDIIKSLEHFFQNQRSSRPLGRFC